jgi:cob(I)alamin adenosyltransferase
MKIYTKTGDHGKTSMLGAANVDKTHQAIEVYGTVDEANAHIGKLIALIYQDGLKLNTDLLLRIQSDLFDLGSELACAKDSYLEKLPRRLTPGSIETLEQAIDEMSRELPELKGFILPGGAIASAEAHLCRTVIRRAERSLIAMKAFSEVHSAYLNRLSDYFFTLARLINKLSGKNDLLWT